MTPFTTAMLLRAHAVVARVVLDLRQPELLEHGRDVHPEPAAQALLQAVPAADRVRLAAAPRLDRPLRRRLALVGAPERHPVARLLEHRVQILDRAQAV